MPIYHVLVLLCLGLKLMSKNHMVIPALISVNSQDFGRSSASDRKSSFTSFTVAAVVDFLDFLAGELSAENETIHYNIML